MPNETPATDLDPARFTRRGMRDSWECEEAGHTHLVPLREWPPRTKNKNKTPSEFGTCTRCLCHVQVFDPPTAVITVLLPDGKRVLPGGEIVAAEPSTAKATKK